MRFTKKTIGITLLVLGIIGLYFKSDIFIETIKKGYDVSIPYEDLFVPILLMISGLFILFYKKKKKLNP